MKIAVIGSGIAGNVAAYELHQRHEVTVYEATARVGGHSHTHDVQVDGAPIAVDTGFIVFNDRTYPRFVALLDRLGVASQESSMSFSVRCEASGLEYNGTTLNTLFAQRRNLLRPAFLRMIRDILRFNREAPGILAGDAAEEPLHEMLARGRYGREFITHYIIPMGAAIWSTDAGSMLAFPARFFVRFLHNHGMLTVNDRPMWRTISGGSARYVERLTAGFRDRIRTESPVERVRRIPGGVVVKACGQEAVRYDAVFMACHSDQALALLADPTHSEREVLGAIRYQRNEAVLHTDARLLPRRRLAWAAWNYHVVPEYDGPVALTYNMNILQRLVTTRPLLVTLNRTAAIDPRSIIRCLSYEHPLFTAASLQAQRRHRELNGNAGTYYCGAWWRNGFHEDGVVSALTAVEHFEHDHAQRTVYRSAQA